MERYYFTFGSWEKFPYQDTYLMVIANGRGDALQTFRDKYPDVYEGTYNFTSCYSEKQWKDVWGECYDAKVPADIIWSKKLIGNNVPEGFDDVFIYVPSAKQIVLIAEGTGGNLLPEDEAEGYVDYIMYYQYALDTGMPEKDGGQMMTKDFVQEKYKRLADSIPDVLEMAYGEPFVECMILA